ncbi:hypothetical protein [Nonomuraea harbinensis]|uniref:Uncharacterized protein n=1 Tax=Nonomuraea harbinensis TaxID=1286938 RepID=A0ABW1C572_9ACTN|nr:hypothetical protein [Nonomuraea harbinensis]
MIAALVLVIYTIAAAVVHTTPLRPVYQALSITPPARVPVFEPA